MNTAYAPSDPRSRSPESWRGRLAALASRGEVAGPRVDECRNALSWWTAHETFGDLVDRGQLSMDDAETLLELLATRTGATR
ncbi:hypothetical protein [Nocardia puris]|uniref:hypothetical protein n=1 Tax=Nocardia puris TaxID=208602 RepID=UPI002E1AA89B